MTRINPLYLGFFLIVLLLFLSFKLNSAKSELTLEKFILKKLTYHL